MKNIIFSLLIITAGCDHFSYSSNCGSYLAAHQQADIAVGQANLHASIWYGGSESLKDSTYALAMVSFVDTSIFNLIIEEFEEYVSFDEISKETKMIALVLYGGKHFEDKDSLTFQDVMGCQFYFRAVDDLTTKVYKKKGNVLEHIKELDGELGFLSTNDIFTCAQIFKQGATNPVTSLLVQCNNSDYEESSVRHHSYHKKLEAYLTSGN